MKWRKRDRWHRREEKGISRGDMYIYNKCVAINKNVGENELWAPCMIATHFVATDGHSPFKGACTASSLSLALFLQPDLMRTHLQLEPGTQNLIKSCTNLHQLFNLTYRLVSPTICVPFHYHACVKLDQIDAVKFWGFLFEFDSIWEHIDSSSICDWIHGYHDYFPRSNSSRRIREFDSLAPRTHHFGPRHGVYSDHGIVLRLKHLIRVRFTITVTPWFSGLIKTFLTTKI